jgi:amino acid transporter
VAVQPVLDKEGLKRDVGLLGLMWASEGSIIGSGWLFGALTAVTIAGPAALLCWVIASIIIVLLALVHAELGGIFPVTGGTSRYPHYAFGSLAGASFGWFAYIQAATVAPIEVLATIQYLSSAHWASSWYKPPATGQINGTLSHAGIVAAVVLMFVYVIVNLLGIRWLAHTNTTITTWKVIVPILTIIVFLLTKFHSGNFSAGGGFFYHTATTSAAKAILVAIPGAGIVFALLGFEQAVQLGGESRNPQRDLPRAVIGAIALGAAIYILVQLAFIGALSPAVIAHYHTWGNLTADASLEAAPFYRVAQLAAVGWLAWVLRIDAVISPGGTGLIYLTSTSRIGFGLSKNGYIPTAFETPTQRRKVPAFGVIIAALIGLVFLLPFPSWSSMVTIVTGASVLMYAGAPLALGALRKSKPDLARSYKLPAHNWLCPLAFVCANLVVYWAGWFTVGTLMVVIIVGYLLMIISRALHLNPAQPVIDWASGAWIFFYLVGMALLSYFGNFGSGTMLGGVGWFKTHLIGGNGDIPLWWDLVIVAAFSLTVYFMAIASRLPEAKVDQYIREVFPPSGELDAPRGQFEAAGVVEPAGLAEPSGPSGFADTSGFGDPSGPSGSAGPSE